MTMKSIAKYLVSLAFFALPALTSNTASAQGKLQRTYKP